MHGLIKKFASGRLRAQIVKEMLSILRDPRSRLIVFVPPLVQLLIFTFATTLEVRNANIAVYNQDAGHWSYEMEARVGAADFVNKVYTVHNRDELRELIDQRKVIAGHRRRPTQQRRPDHGRLSQRHRGGCRRHRQEGHTARVPGRRPPLVQSQSDLPLVRGAGLVGHSGLLQRTDDHGAVDRPRT